ncbi:MAG: VOC family protein [Pseudomonadota bacterium]
MTLALDHLVWGTPDLDHGCATIENLFGIAPSPGGSHPGIGTCNALLGLGPNLYLEIMAPDNPASGSIGARLAELKAPGLVTWVLRTSDLSRVELHVEEMHDQVTSLGPIPSQRVTPQGHRLEWTLLFLTLHNHNGLLPFFIDWQQTEHPSVSTPQGGRLMELEIGSPHSAHLNALLTRVDAPHSAVRKPLDELTAHFQTKAGHVSLQSTRQSLSVMNM